MHHVDGFRWRTREITRIEGFSDAVFGFAVTLLIVSLEVPHTSTELLNAMTGFGSFLATFVVLASIWYAQYLFFRRYGLEDRVTVTMNLALLFTVLFFAYPLKFLFSTMLSHPAALFKPSGSHELHPAVLPEHKPLIFFIFGAGYAAVMGLFFLLYRHAWKNRDELDLNEYEIFETQHAMRRFAYVLAVGASYFLLGAIMMLPHRTPGQKTLVEALDYAFAILVLLLVFRMMKLMRERRRRRKEWITKMTQPPE